MNAHNEIVCVLNADRPTRKLLCNLLASEGLGSIACATGEEYLAHPAAGRAACLVTDANLPDMSGLDLQAGIADRGTSVLFVAACSDVSTSVRAIKAGAIDFLIEPLCKRKFLEAVRAALDQHRCERASRLELLELRERWSRLTAREREVMKLVVSGLLNKQMAVELGISQVTVQVHRGNLMQKMAARSLAELVRMAQTLDIPLSAAGRRQGRKRPGPTRLSADIL